MRKKLIKLLSVTIVGVMVISVVALGVSAYKDSKGWDVHWAHGAPSGTNKMTHTSKLSADGHQNIWVSCTQFQGINFGVIVNFNSTSSAGAGISGRFTNTRADQAYAQTNIAPWGTNVYVNFELDIGSATGTSIINTGNCHTHS